MQTKNTTAKAKLDAALGIAPDKSIDEFLNSLSIENNSAKEAVEKIDQTVKDEISAIDSEIHNITAASSELIDNENQKILSLVAIDKSLKNIDELIIISKEVIKHIYENIICTELVDSELIHAAAAFIESCHLNVKEYIDLYKDRLKFYDKIQFEMLQQKHRKEILDYKHKLEMEKIENKAIDVTSEGMVAFNHDDITKFLKNEGI